MKADELFFVKKYRGIATDGMDLKKRDGFFLDYWNHLSEMFLSFQGNDEDKRGK